MPSIEHQFLKGSLDVLLLRLLERGSLYGYQIVKELRTRSEGVLDLKEGTLYPALHRLEKAGLIEGYWEQRLDGADRRYYRLTPRGREVAQEQQAAWRRFTAAVDGVLRHA